MHDTVVITPLLKRSLIKCCGMCPFSSISVTNERIFSCANFDTKQTHTQIIRGNYYRVTLETVQLIYDISNELFKC